MKQTSLILWFLAPLPLLYGAMAQAPGLSDVVKVADVAREKDVVWLSLVVAICAIAFSGWVVALLMRQYREARDDMLHNSKVHSENAQAVGALANSLDDLRREMERRPCVLPLDRR